MHERELVPMQREILQANMWLQHGLAALSPFLANVFMSSFETSMKQQGNFSRIWCRYVDDVWAVMKKQWLRQFLNRLNNSNFSTIKFTYEEEVNDKLYFIDVTVWRIDGKFEFDIHRKPINTSRYITSDSFHSFEHKTSSFRSMIHRALHIPLIKEIANINGYTAELFAELIIAHERKRELHDCTTLNMIEDDGDEEKLWTKSTIS